MSIKKNLSETYLEKVSLLDIIKCVGDMLPLDQKSQVELEYNLPILVVGPKLLKLLMLNLFQNSIKYSRPDIMPRIKVRSIKKSKKVEIFVKDNKIDIPENGQKRVFEPFVRGMEIGKNQGSAQDYLWFQERYIK